MGWREPRWQVLEGVSSKGGFPPKKSFPLISATEFAMNAEIISVGTELLLGHTINTDAAFVARELSAIGVNLLFACTAMASLLLVALSFCCALCSSVLFRQKISIIFP